MTRPYATLPGGELSGAKTTERYFTLIGRFIGTSEADLHAKRQELLEELAIDTYPENQAVRVRFSGATVQKQISAYYTGGLEAQLKVSYGPWQVESDDALDGEGSHPVSCARSDVVRDWGKFRSTER
jgi:hypothetical protein